MGQADGDLDERPVHEITLSKPFFISAVPVTNAQYEKFDPSHKSVRGKMGLSKEDDEPVLFVSWYEAVKYCEWLRQKEGKPYRLPTEAEWEYACRAGTSTAYSMGDALPEVYRKNQENVAIPLPVSLKVGQTPPNAWGLYDMYGLVEEWCQDWYGPYEARAITDPGGHREGLWKVTRGGSHNTPVEFLRSANRLGTLPEDRHWLIGFRVAMGEQAPLTFYEKKDPPLWAREVSQTVFDYSKNEHTSPFFAEPVSYVRFPENHESIPIHRHNHCPSITGCPNGDLLAVWFSTESEKGREMTILASRLRAGQTEWDTPSEFFKAPDRNMSGSSLFHDDRGTLYHFNGLGAAGTYANLALVMRTSRDNGRSWSTRLINPDHQRSHQVISGTFVTRESVMVQPCDSDETSDGDTVLYLSRDKGESWSLSQGVIAGIHGAVTQLEDGSLLAFGRWGKRVGLPNEKGELKMPMSRSRDMGRGWEYSASVFPPINGGQRPVLMRLREGPLLFLSFTDHGSRIKKKQPLRGMVIEDAGGRRTIFGLFAALSWDEGRNWSVRRPLTGGPKTFPDAEWTRDFVMDYNHAEPRGYLAGTQTPDGMIHLISSALYYRFNLAWIKEPMHPEKDT